MHFDDISPETPNLNHRSFPLHFPLANNYYVQNGQHNTVPFQVPLAMSCFSHGDQAEEAYSSCGLIRVLYICSFTDIGAFLMFQRIIPRVELALAVTSSICLDHRKLDCRTTPKYLQCI